MKKVIITAILALVLVLAMAGPAMAATADKTATVVVKSYISVTLTDEGGAGLNWADLDPGTVKTDADAAELAIGTDGKSITVAAGSENNGDTDIKLSGTDFSGGIETFAISNAWWDDDATVADATLMKETGTGTDTVGTLSASGSLIISHWLEIPDQQPAETYTSTFTYEAVGATIS